jgi:hypothetical protein
VIDDLCVDLVGCDALPTVGTFVMQNSIFLGFLDTNNPTWNGSIPGFYCGASCNDTFVPNAAWTWDNNISFNNRNTPSTGTGNQWATNPAVVQLIPDISTFSGESAALAFNMNLTSGSPAIGAGLENAYVPTYDNVGHPYANPPSIGAYEFQTGPSTSAYFSGSVVISGSGVMR